MQSGGHYYEDTFTETSRNNQSLNYWTMDEHVRFIDAMREFGRDWKSITEAVATRKIDQVRSHG